ncbi:hypothetical protein IGI04_015605 [Brassica rapa subsp. trilocularis]|uniref:Obg domain-containing protein n=1 Tax=Brassica rapa subsp. trilocularis TaxID=1813537 RepID=A0ABQ7MQI6_BRACM|nr:hypothetical protein IGI04_015605 [Brassica rapa subsp. trilocularis]
MLLLRLERGDESDDGGIVTSPRFTRGGFSTRIKGDRFGGHGARRGVAVTSSLHHLKAKRGTHSDRY